MWSDLLVENTNRAAALRTDCKVKGEEKKEKERRRKRGKRKGREECVLVVGEIVPWWV